MRQPVPARLLRAVIFDFDGTLAAPALDFALLRQRALRAVAAFNPPPDSGELPVMEEIERLCAALAPEQAAAARRAAHQAVEEVELEAARRTSLFAFTRPMLEALKTRHVACAVVTRNCAAAVYTVFPDLDRHCRCVITREQVARVKPHPEHMGAALRLLGCEAGQTLGVGDHPMDVEAGKGVGVYTAAVASGDTPRALLERTGADLVAGDAGEVMRRLGLME